MGTHKNIDVPVVHERGGVFETLDRIQNMIRERADSIFHDRNPGDGDEISDWLQAESEILSEVGLSLKNDKKEVVIEGTIKGFSPKEVEVKAEDGLITIAGIHDEEASDKKEGVTTKSSKHMSFCQSYNLPDSVDAEKIKVKLKGDKFKATIPKIMH